MAKYAVEVSHTCRLKMPRLTSPHLKRSYLSLAKLRVVLAVGIPNFEVGYILEAVISLVAET